MRKLRDIWRRIRVSIFSYLAPSNSYEAIAAKLRVLLRSSPSQWRISELITSINSQFNISVNITDIQVATQNPMITLVSRVNTTYLLEEGRFNRLVALVASQQIKKLTKTN